MTESPKPTLTADLSGQVALVTGASRGLLASQGSPRGAAAEQPHQQQVFAYGRIAEQVAVDFHGREHHRRRGRGV